MVGAGAGAPGCPRVIRRAGPGQAREGRHAPGSFGINGVSRGRDVGRRHYSGYGERNAQVVAEGRAMAEVAQGDQASPLDQPQEFADASSCQVRDELAGLIERDLLGPWDGEAEVLPPRSADPGERYLVGRLGPRHEPRSGMDTADHMASTSWPRSPGRETGACARTPAGASPGPASAR